ncbi:glycosyltransferase [Pedobacter sp. LMG 31464]|uniref:Glycosyltransferase n=1 Tax=Pedobacter planticolens TaxID=2679964 RepID=A0A923E0F8_9SPHI|nr:glycosyltransferase family 2 protein [Pedobacter planticolens]MBB2146441.1 glycosyltransferase [Pedobacter planticolens]
MKDKIVSIIIPTYNYGHLIAQTLNCLIAQSYKNWEAIIIDDGSSDNTEEIVNSFLVADDRFIFIKQNNKGVSSARNTGLKKAKGNYIQFLDADDLISIHKIENQLNFLELNEHIDICLVDTKYFESDNDQILFSDLNLKNDASTPKLNGKGFNVLSAFVQNNQTVIQSPLFSKKIIAEIGLFNERTAYLEDWDFWFRCAAKNYQFGFLDDQDSLVLVRVHQNSASKKTTLIYEAEAILRRKFIKYIKDIDFISPEEKMVLLKQNRNSLRKTFRDLMADTSLYDFKKWKFYYEQLNSFSLFSSSFIKALNVKRKSNKS